MNVFQINTVCGSGSTGRIAVNLARMLEEKGDRSLIAYARGQAPQNVVSFKFGNKFSIALHGVLTRVTDRHGLYSTHGTKELIKKIQEENPDIIHLHNIHGYYVNIKLLFEFLREYQKPVVWTLHDCWSYTGHCAYYSFAGCDKWKTGCENCKQKKAYPGSLIIDASRENYAEKKKLFTSLEKFCLVTPSTWLKEEVEQSFFQGKEVVAIPNGIDTKVFVPTESDIKERYGLQKKKVLLGVANLWEERKGLSDFIELGKQLDDSYVIVLIGLSKEQIASLPEGIIGIERTANIAELVQWYSAADIYINASVEETMGLTTGEAICCGTPVIAYDATAIPESVKEGCGLVVEPKQVNQVKAAIEEIIKNRPDYVEGCKKQREGFAKHLAEEAYYRLYQKMMGK